MNDLIKPAAIIIACLVLLIFFFWLNRAYLKRRNRIPVLNEKALARMPKGNREILEKLGVRLLTYELTYESEAEGSLFSDNTIRTYTGVYEDHKVVFRNYAIREIGSETSFKVSVYFKERIPGDFVFAYRVNPFLQFDLSMDLTLMDWRSSLFGGDERLYVKNKADTLRIFKQDGMKLVLHYLIDSCLGKFRKKWMIIDNMGVELECEPFGLLNRKDLHGLVKAVEKFEGLFGEKA